MWMPFYWLHRSVFSFAFVYEQCFSQLVCILIVIIVMSIFFLEMIDSIVKFFIFFVLVFYRDPTILNTIFKVHINKMLKIIFFNMTTSS